MDFSLHRRFPWSTRSDLHGFQWGLQSHHSGRVWPMKSLNTEYSLLDIGIRPSTNVVLDIRHLCLKIDIESHIESSCLSLNGKVGFDKMRLVFALFHLLFVHVDGDCWLRLTERWTCYHSGIESSCSMDLLGWCVRLIGLGLVSGSNIFVDWSDSSSRLYCRRRCHSASRVTPIAWEGSHHVLYFNYRGSTHTAELGWQVGAEVYFHSSNAPFTQAYSRLVVVRIIFVSCVPL